MAKAFRPSFTQVMQTKEAKVRGIYLSIACDFESLMDDLIVLCELDKAANIQEYKQKKVRHLTMGQKTGRCEKGLKKYNEFYYAAFQNHFIVINKLVKYRNLLAHGYSEYADAAQDTSVITFENYDKKLYRETIEIDPFITELLTYRNTIMELMGLVVIIRKENNLFPDDLTAPSNVS